MLITPDFIFLQNGKTGTTSVSAAIQEYHKNRLDKRSLTKKILDKAKFSLHASVPYCIMESTVFNDEFSTGIKTKHVPLIELKSRYSHLPIISSIRRPIDFVISHYTYGAWKARAAHNGLPHYDVKDFIAYIHHFRNKKSHLKGLFSQQFNSFHSHPTLCPNPIEDPLTLDWLRTESLQSDWRVVRKKMNLDYDIVVKHKNKSTKKVTHQEECIINDYIQHFEQPLDQVYRIVSHSLRRSGTGS